MFYCILKQILISIYNHLKQGFSIRPQNQIKKLHLSTEKPQQDKAVFENDKITVKIVVWIQ
jgi:hypothetical protein